jgi:hypothetical protein
LLADTLSHQQLYSLGWGGFPGDQFAIRGVSALNMKQFLLEGAPVTQYADYLGLID